jgi:hypothetical protein
LLVLRLLREFWGLDIKIGGPGREKEDAEEPEVAKVAQKVQTNAMYAILKRDVRDGSRVRFD